MFESLEVPSCYRGGVQEDMQGAALEREIGVQMAVIHFMAAAEGRACALFLLWFCCFYLVGFKVCIRLQSALVCIDVGDALPLWFGVSGQAEMVAVLLDFYCDI